MKSIKALFLFLIFLLFVQVLLTGINILQNGGRTWDGRSPANDGGLVCESRVGIDRDDRDGYLR